LFYLSKWCLYIYLKMNNLEEMILLMNIVNTDPSLWEDQQRVGFHSMLSEFSTNTIVTRWPRCATFYIEISYLSSLPCLVRFYLQCLWCSASIWNLPTQIMNLLNIFCFPNLNVNDSNLFYQYLFRYILNRKLKRGWGFQITSACGRTNKELVFNQCCLNFPLIP
jgi:hypothetical protein